MNATDTSGRIDAFVLTELNLADMIRRALSGSKVCVIARMPMAPGGEKLLGCVEDWLLRTGRAVDIRALLPATARFWVPTPHQAGFYSGHFTAGFEKAVEIHHDFGRIDRLAGIYAAAIRGVIGHNHTPFAFLIFMLRDIVESPLDILVHGFDRDLRAYYRAYWGEEPGKVADLPLQFRPLVNAAGAILAFAKVLTHVARRFSLSPPPPEEHLMGVDFFEANVRGINLVDNILCGDAEPLFVARTEAIFEEGREMLRGRFATARTRGTIDLETLPSFLATAAFDIARLWRIVRNLPPRTAREVYGLVYWRVVYRSLFRRYRIRYFWGRDDYTSEHHMRSQEIRRIGGRSMGIQHGVNWASMHAGYRYLDFDYYYAYGQEHGRLATWLERWPAHMKVRVVGTWGMTRAEMAALPATRPKDILVSTSNAPGGLEMLEVIRALASAFPDRTIWFRPKAREYKLLPELTKAIREILEAPPQNLRLDENRWSYGIFGKVGYMVSNASSFVAEGLQFGVKAFVLDRGFDHPEPWPLLYRHYPFLCVRTAEDAIARIRGIESGEWRYPREDAADLICLTGENIFDTIRADLGLPSAEPAAPSAVAAAAEGA